MLYCSLMRLARLLLAAVALLGACSGGDGGRTDDTLPPRGSSTTSTTVDYSVPAVIDVAYVEKVMEALDHVYGDAIRILAREREITKDFLEHLAAIYGDRFFELAQRAWVREVADELPTLAEHPRDPTTEITELVQATPECVVARVFRDFGPTRKTPPKPTPQRFIALIPQRDRDVSRLNPTPWIMSYDGYTDTGAIPDRPCDAQSR